MHRNGGHYLPGFVLHGAGVPARSDPRRNRGTKPQCAMIAPVNGCRAVICAFVWITARNAAAADDPAGAARELARKTAAFAGRGEPVSISWRNLSTLSPSVLTQTRSAFEAALHDAGARIGDGASVAAQLTLSENAAQYLLVEEIRRGDERQVWIAAWK